MSLPPQAYRVTFVCEVSFTTDVVAEDPPDAHFTAFCETASALQNDPVIRDQLQRAGIRINLLHPKYLRSVQPLNESISS